MLALRHNIQQDLAKNIIKNSFEDGDIHEVRRTNISTDDRQKVY